ncbi:hypothetical protein HMPREF0044_0646 [Gleimia coleocanis DSM 15436]|uniref:DUF885 domain-containing protein n=1 Tax=Gleimia coleocanis DSM 15436 TaxID=525245 RepID=C0W0Q3_9ACTO|nr:DUF885 domain-containing protein [Gleimia coleocanis]EEH63627.1 hypothetical protein HMPREF0044_0646 [Gleimia coleocanis DSM 15436]
MSREMTALDKIAEDYVAKVTEFSPGMRIALGLRAGIAGFDDFSPEGAKRYYQLAKETKALVEACEVADEVDRVTKAALLFSLEQNIEGFENNDHLGNLNNIASPVQEIRDGFDLMPTATADDWQDVLYRLEAVPTAYASYQAALEAGMELGLLPTRVQARAASEDLASTVADANPFARMRDDYREWATSENADSAKLDAATEAATNAAKAFKAWFDAELAPLAVNDDRVGKERYVRASRSFLGATIDTDATYEWAKQELARIHAQQVAIAEELFGAGTSVFEAMKRLDDDPKYQVYGTDGLKKWMQETSDQAMNDLADVHFTVKPQMRALECMISTTGSGGIYYTGPSDDFSRPGRMWWACPPDQEIFHTWQEKTTVYHEGMPGHHMQVSLATSAKEQLNSWRRNFCWYSGHGEGWALYAEDLMDKLGYMQDPADRMGMLDAQRLRAARVIVDIGVHTKKQLPGWEYLESVGITRETYEESLANSPFVDLGDTDTAEDEWDRNHMWAFMNNNVAMSHGFLVFEVTRYLGWPGQASSYKVGQKQWEEIRDAFTTAYPEKSLKEFHDMALLLGGLPLEVLHLALTGE